MAATTELVEKLNFNELSWDPKPVYLVLVHRLRRAPDYRDTLALPLQMHLAKLTEEYVLPHDPDAD
jgi:RNaseH domain of pPIWI_RE